MCSTQRDMILASLGWILMFLIGFVLSFWGCNIDFSHWLKLFLRTLFFAILIVTPVGIWGGIKYYWNYRKVLNFEEFFKNRKMMWQYILAPVLVATPLIFLFAYIQHRSVKGIVFAGWLLMFLSLMMVNFHAVLFVCIGFAWKAKQRER